MHYFSSFAIGGFVPSAAVAGVLLLVGLGAFFYLGIKDLPIIKAEFNLQMVILIFYNLINSTI
tara:strand:+ start:419 stop:607 length:189 start_codon:yes stop_codon:yes gene_type:complete